VTDEYVREIVEENVAETKGPISRELVAGTATARFATARPATVCGVSTVTVIDDASPFVM
jgi:hypothetical protein